MPTPLVAVATAGLVGLVAVLGLGVVATLAGGGIDGLLATWGGVPDRGPGPVAPPSPGAAVVVHVVDGDTLVVRFRGGGEARLRLIGIDTPESVATDRPNECFGQEASAALAALLPAGTPVRVERDVEPRDRYDRLLGYVYRAADGLFVNHHLVAHGFAEAKSYPPNTTYEAAFEAAEATARAHDEGLWRACGSPDVPL